MQPTSIEAYDKIVHDLGNRQYEVYTLLKEVEPACNKEISKKLNLPINEVTPRVNELRYKGVVEEAFKAEYEGRKVIYWQTTAPAQFKKIVKEESHAVSWLEEGEKI